MSSRVLARFVSSRFLSSAITRVGHSILGHRYGYLDTYFWPKTCKTSKMLPSTTLGQLSMLDTYGRVRVTKERAAEIIYVNKKIEKEKLEKLARYKGLHPEEKPPTAAGNCGSVTNAKATRQTSNSGDISVPEHVARILTEMILLFFRLVGMFFRVLIPWTIIMLVFRFLEYLSRTHF